jgi:hypothetical protein
MDSFHLLKSSATEGQSVCTLVTLYRCVFFQFEYCIIYL